MRPWTDGWLMAGYAGVSGFQVLEATLRQPEGATPATEDDQGTTRAIVASTTAVALSAPLLRQLPLPPLPEGARPLGVGLQALGLGLRAWSMRTLQASYSHTLRVTNTQGVVDRGPYRHIRHPGYLGSLLVWVGFALSSGSVGVLGLVLGLIVPVYRRRIQAEEELLRKELDGYEEYSERTARLVPAVW